MLLCCVAACVFFLPDALYDFSRSVVATAVFLSNMFFWKNSGYFETGALDRPLLHTWSLAIEEQFYIVIPIALFLFVVYARRWTFALFALAAAAVCRAQHLPYRQSPDGEFLRPADTGLGVAARGTGGACAVGAGDQIAFCAN